MTEPAAPAAPPAPRRTSALAIAALACGIAGLTVFPLLASFPAVVLGTMARGELRRDPTLEGDGLATAGLVLGWIGVALAVLGLLVFLFLVLLLLGF